MFALLVYVSGLSTLPTSSCAVGEHRRNNILTNLEMILTLS